MEQIQSSIGKDIIFLKSSNFYVLQYYNKYFLPFHRHFAEDVTRQIIYVCDVNPYREGKLCFTRPLSEKKWHGEFLLLV